MSCCTRRKNPFNRRSNILSIRIEPAILARLDMLLERLGIRDRSPVLRTLISAFTASLERIVNGEHPLDVVKYAASQAIDERGINHMEFYSAVAAAVMETINTIIELADNIITVKEELEEVATSEHIQRILSPLIGIDTPILLSNNNDYDNDGLGEAAMA